VLGENRNYNEQHLLQFAIFQFFKRNSLIKKFANAVVKVLDAQNSMQILIYLSFVLFTSEFFSSEKPTKFCLLTSKKFYVQINTRLNILNSWESCLKLSV